MNDSKPAQYCLRYADCTDELRLFEWANDPEIRVQSFSNTVIERTQHAR